MINANSESKKVIVEKIKGNIAGAASITIVDYRGLTVEQDTSLRKSMRDAGVVYKVYKNSMFGRAIEGTEFEDLKKHLEGPTAVAISQDDATAGPRVLAEAAKKLEKLEFKAGVVEGNYYDAKGIEKIGNIAPREELLGRLLGSFKSPISSFARVIKEIASKKEEA